MSIEKAIKTVEGLLMLAFTTLFLIGAFVAAIGFVAGATLLSWGFVTWAWRLIP